MKIRDIYYIDEPKNLEADSFEVRVLTEPDPGDQGGYEYAFEVTTIKFITGRIAEKNKTYFCGGNTAPLLIVASLDDKTIQQAIEDLLPNIDKMALRIE